jgi:glycosyltransferase involved in cell wall biosynthesis
MPADLCVLSVAYPLFPVGPDSSGGAEQILFLLDREIVRRGRRSLVIGASGSEISGQLIATAASNGLITDAVRADAHRQHRIAIETAIKEHDVDLIHFHGLDFDHHVPKTSLPMLVTLHLPLAWYSPAALARRDVLPICVSRSQAADTGFPVVSNGIDLARFNTAKKSDFLLWMGRICPEKGTHIALQVAHALSMPLVVAGPVHAFESHQTYFHDQVKPLLDRDRRCLGSVGGHEKYRLLAEARCVLIPSLVAETSSLVAMEAIASGTPVIAFPNGALPEIVDNGRTGFIVESESEMIEAVQKLDSISPDVCTSTAETRFDVRRMADDYFNVYASLVRSR